MNTFYELMLDIGVTSQLHCRCKTILTLGASFMGKSQQYMKWS